MQRQRGELVPIDDVVSGLDDVLVKAIRDEVAPGAALFHRGRSSKPACQRQRSGPGSRLLHGANDGVVQPAPHQPRQPNPKPESKPPDSLHREASQAAGAAPTLRYGPAGDSALRLRLKAAGMAEREPFGPSTRPECSAFGRGAVLSNAIK